MEVSFELQEVESLLATLEKELIGVQKTAMGDIIRSKCADWTKLFVKGEDEDFARKLNRKSVFVILPSQLTDELLMAKMLEITGSATLVSRKTIHDLKLRLNIPALVIVVRTASLEGKSYWINLTSHEYDNTLIDRSMCSIITGFDDKGRRVYGIGTSNLYPLLGAAEGDAEHRSDQLFFKSILSTCYCVGLVPVIEDQKIVEIHHSNIIEKNIGNDSEYLDS